MATSRADAALLQSLLFLPADRLDRLGKAIASGSDAVILDLEDGVGASNKADARLAAMRFFDQRPAAGVFALRPSSIMTEAGLQDLIALRQAARLPDLVMLPKVESVAEIKIALAHLTRTDGAPGIIALIESARGLSAAEDVAAHRAVVGLALGGADLAADLRATLAWEPMLFARGRIVQAAAFGGIPAWDVPFLDLGDADGLGRESSAIRALGFSGKLAIHPSQIDAIHAAFEPDDRELQRARRIVDAFELAGGGVCLVDGRMVDMPVVLAARRATDLASRRSSLSGRQRSTPAAQQPVS